jgi:hypothetical protein
MPSIRFALPCLVACLAASPAFAQFSGGPDAFGMSYTTVPIDFVPLTGDPAATTYSLGDDGEATVTLPFAFPYYGNTWTTATLSSNGGLRFGGGAQISYTNSCGATPTISSPDLMAFWDDL